VRFIEAPPHGGLLDHDAAFSGVRAVRLNLRDRLADLVASDALQQRDEIAADRVLNNL
jgi:hypothetical protein